MAIPVVQILFAHEATSSTLVRNIKTAFWPKIRF